MHLVETGAHPIVYGDWLRAEGQPTALIYGHYDVQPVDPLDAWRVPPFKPVGSAVSLLYSAAAYPHMSAMLGNGVVFERRRTVLTHDSTMFPC